MNIDKFGRFKNNNKHNQYGGIYIEIENLKQAIILIKSDFVVYNKNTTIETEGLKQEIIALKSMLDNVSGRLNILFEHAAQSDNV